MELELNEVIENLEYLVSDSCTDTQFDYLEEIEIATKSLEKQIPKKPTPIDYKKYMDVIDNARFLRGAYWCPNCKHVVKSGSYCSDCGQALDWSDENEID